MSDTPFEIVTVVTVEPHPHADRLEVVGVLGTHFVSGKGDFVPGDSCAYFPPDMLTTEIHAICMGVVSYLKHAIRPGDMKKSKCRISAIRLRGIPSFGFGLPFKALSMYFPSALPPVGTDITALFDGEKYQPPERLGGDGAPDIPSFHRYTDIQHYYKNEGAIGYCTLVRITEKIHGTNSRVGWVEGEWVCGSHNCRKKGEPGCRSAYWTPLTARMKALLLDLSGHKANVVVFGEIYGEGVQKMDYGTPICRGYRVFDITVDGEYLDWVKVKTTCANYGILTVPVLYTGSFHPELIEQFVDGPTTLSDSADIKSKFKGREGIVITPLTEQPAGTDIGGRLILKAVSADYYEAMG